MLEKMKLQSLGFELACKYFFENVIEKIVHTGHSYA